MSLRWVTQISEFKLQIISYNCCTLGMVYFLPTFCLIRESRLLRKSSHCVRALILGLSDVVVFKYRMMFLYWVDPDLYISQSIVKKFLRDVCLWFFLIMSCVAKIYFSVCRTFELQAKISPYFALRPLYRFPMYLCTQFSPFAYFKRMSSPHSQTYDDQLYKNFLFENCITWGLL